MVKNFSLIALLFLTLPIFFNKLGQTSLTSFDEAWYGEIARNIADTGNIFSMSWAGGLYIDHPPGIFWLMAIFIKTFGDNEFVIRLTSALLGFLSVIILYFIGKELFNKWVGFASGLALSSSIWFVFRARSGNLDIPLTFFFLLTFLLALKSVKNGKFLIPFSISLSFLFLSKTIVPFTIIPSLVIIFWKSKLKVSGMIRSSLIFILISVPWFVISFLNQPGFIPHYFQIGLPGVKSETNYVENFKLIKEYLHAGIGKWFWPGIVSTILGIFLRQRRFLALSAFSLVFFLPFVFSSKGHIWHLIPLYPFLILEFFGFAFILMEKFIKEKKIVISMILLISLYFSLSQIRQIWYQFIDIPAYVSDEAILSKEASKYPVTFYIDGDFVPAAIFYSKKGSVGQVNGDSIKSLFADNKSFTLITEKWHLDALNIPKSSFKILKSDRDKILILKQ